MQDSCTNSSFEYHGTPREIFFFFTKVIFAELFVFKAFQVKILNVANVGYQRILFSTASDSAQIYCEMLQTALKSPLKLSQKALKLTYAADVRANFLDVRSFCFVF